MTSSAQLERQTEAIRAEIAHTLDELRARITPGQVVDQAVDYARDSGASEFLRNLRQEAVSNPMAIGLVGAGLAWLMMSNRRSARADGGWRVGSSGGGLTERARGSAADTAAAAGDAARRFGDTASSTASEYADRASSTAGELRDEAKSAAANLGSTASNTARRLGEAANATTESVLDSATAAYGTAADRTRRAASASADLASTVRHNVADTSRGVLNLFRDQPLVLAGIGIAVGAAIGAALPATETENELMGEASDDLKQQAKDVVEEQYDKAKDFAAEGYEKVKSAAGEQLREGLDQAANKVEGLASSDRDSGSTPAPSDQGAQDRTEDWKKTEKAYGQS
jgi:hypothetical protein